MQCHLKRVFLCALTARFCSCWQCHCLCLLPQQHFTLSFSIVFNPTAVTKSFNLFQNLNLLELCFNGFELYIHLIQFFLTASLVFFIKKKKKKTFFYVYKYVFLFSRTTQSLRHFMFCFSF